MKNTFKRLLVLSFLLSSITHIYAQTRELNIDVSNLSPAPKLTILSEVHISLNPFLNKSNLIKRLHDSDHVNDLILETGTSTAYLCNLFVQTGDTNILNALYPILTGPRKGYFLREISVWNRNGNTLTIHGIDFERPVFLIAIKYLCERTRHTNNKMYRYIISLPDTIQRLGLYDQQRKERRALLRESEKIYREEKAYYDAIIDIGFSMKSVFENHASESNFAARDAAMAMHFREILQHASGNILMCSGSYHIENNGKLYRKIIDESPLEKKDVRVISMLCKNCRSGGLYFEMKQRDFAGNAAFLADAQIRDRIFAEHAVPGQVQIVPTDSDFYARYPVKPARNIDDVMIVNCTEE